MSVVITPPPVFAPKALPRAPTNEVILQVGFVTCNSAYIGANSGNKGHVTPIHLKKLAHEASTPEVNGNIVP